MTAAQDYLVSRFVALINAKNAEQATSVGQASGVFQVTGTTRFAPIYKYITTGPSASSIASGSVVTITSTDAAADPAKGTVVVTIPADVATNDRIALDTPGTIIEVAVPADFPSPGGFDRRLVVYENNPNATGRGRMFAIPPNEALGVPIPTWRIVNEVPKTGIVAGESVYSVKNSQGFVWSGTGWQNVTSSPIKQYADDTTLLADATPSVGSYATSLTTGNLYLKTAAGWRYIGITEFATVAALNAATPADGSLAEVLSDGSLWQRSAGKWRSVSIRGFATTTDLDAWTAPANYGDRAIVTDIEVFFVRTASGWRPESFYEDTEANIRAATGWPKNGQEAIATDTGRNFAFVGGAWIEEPINHYTTEVLLRAATPPNGTLAWADDTNQIFARAGGGWIQLGGQNGVATVAAAAPAGPVNGQMWLNTGTAGTPGLNIRNGANWDLVSRPWVTLTQTQYDALVTKDPNTLYVIVGA